MSVILILILASLATALLFLGAFIWAVRSGQFEDMHTPSVRVLMDDPQFGRDSGGTADVVAPSPAAGQAGPRDGGVIDESIPCKP